MKTIVILILTVCFIFTGCISNGEIAEIQEYDFGNESMSFDEHHILKELTSENEKNSFVSLRAPLPIEEIINDSYIIVKGRIDKAEKVDIGNWSSEYGDLYNCNFVITEFLKGSIPETEITFRKYSYFLLFEEGKEYILFVHKRMSIYLGDSYEADTLIFCADGGKITQQYQHGREYTEKLFLTVDDLKRFIDKNTRNIRDNGEVLGYKYIESDDIEDIVEFSDVIIKVKITESELINPEKGLCWVKYDYIDTYKGTIDIINKLTFFKDQVQIGKEALVLLIKKDGSDFYAISSRNSVIYEDDERYDEYLAYIGLDYLKRKENLKALGLPAYFTSSESYLKQDVSLRNPEENCFIDIVGTWEVEWESRESASFKTYTSKKKNIVFRQDGTGSAEEGLHKDEFSWKYVLLDGECVGVEFCGENVKKQRLMLESEDGKGFIFSHLDIGGERGRTDFSDVKFYKMNKTSPHIRITTDEWTHIPRGRVTSSEIDGLCADMVPFYVEGDDVYLKYYNDVDMDIEIIGEGGSNLSYRVYDDNYWTLSPNQDKLPLFYVDGKFIIGIHAGWSNEKGSVGYEFLIGLNVEQ